MKLLAALVFSSIFLNICSCQDVGQNSNDNLTLYERIKSYMSNNLDEEPTQPILVYNVPLQSIEFSDSLLNEVANFKLTNEKGETNILKVIEVRDTSNNLDEVPTQPILVLQTTKFSDSLLNKDANFELTNEKGETIILKVNEIGEFDNSTLYERIKSSMSNNLDEVPTQPIVVYNVTLQTTEFSDSLPIEDANFELTNEKREKIILEAIEVGGFDNLTLYERIKSYIVSQITNMSNNLDEVPTQPILLYDVPLQSIEFSDSLLIEDANFELTNEKREEIILEAIEVGGFSNAAWARFGINKDLQRVTFQVAYTDIRVKFHYTVSNISDTGYGRFEEFQFQGNVNYTEDHQNSIHLEYWNSTQSKSEIYCRPSTATNGIHNLTTEENIKTLWEEVHKQILEKIAGQIYTRIIESTLEATSQNSIAAMERSYISDEMHDIIENMRSLIKPGEALEVENANADKDTETEDQITISSIKLMGIENYHLNSSNVSIYDGYIGANYKIIIPNVNTTVNFTIYDDDDNNRQVIADYSIKQIVLDLFVRKNVNVTGIELQRAVFGVLELEPYLNQGQHDETEMALIRNSTELLYAPITNIIENFFEHDLRLVRLEGATHYYQRLTKKESGFDQTKHYYEIEVDNVFIY